MQASLTSLLKQFGFASNLGIWLLIGFLRVFSWLPLPVIYLFSCILGEILFWLFRSRRRVTLKNISSCFPHLKKHEHYSIARKHFHHLTCTSLATGIAWWASEKRLDRLGRIVNEERYLDAKAQGQNVIFLAPHFVCLDFSGIFVSKKWHVSSMYQTHKNPLMDELIKTHRGRFGAILFSSKKPIKELIKMVSEGHPFYYLPDQDAGTRKGQFAPFYDIQASTYPVLGRMAKISNAVVIPCVGYLRPWGTGIDVHLLPPLSPFPVEDNLENMTLMNKRIEEAISHSPHQYFWSHKRFKTRPEGEKPFYS